MRDTLKALLVSFVVMFTLNATLPVEVDAADYVSALEPTPIENLVWPIPPEVEEVVEDIYVSPFSTEEIELLALVTMAEAESEPELGKRLVIDTILNRVDSQKFPVDIFGVVYQKGQFTSMTNGRVNRCYVRDDIVQLVNEEIRSRTNYDVLYFRSGHFFSWATPLFQVGGHYFSC